MIGEHNYEFLMTVLKSVKNTFFEPFSSYEVLNTAISCSKTKCELEQE